MPPAHHNRFPRDRKEDVEEGPKWWYPRWAKGTAFVTFLVLSIVVAYLAQSPPTALNLPYANLTTTLRAATHDESVQADILPMLNLTSALDRDREALHKLVENTLRNNGQAPPNCIARRQVRLSLTAAKVHIDRLASNAQLLRKLSSTTRHTTSRLKWKAEREVGVYLRDWPLAARLTQVGIQTSQQLVARREAAVESHQAMDVVYNAMGMQCVQWAQMTHRVNTLLANGNFPSEDQACRDSDNLDAFYEHVRRVLVNTVKVS